MNTIGVKSMNTNNEQLTSFIETRLSCVLAPDSSINVSGIAADLARALKNGEYCTDPYLSYEQALCCQVNKRREKACLMTSCKNNDFCRLLRKEGYIT